MTLRIGIGGIGGRMGREIVAAADSVGGVSVVGGVERTELVSAIQASLGSGIRVVDSIEQVLSDVDVVIDFSTPESTLAHARSCAAVGMPFVSGVTGLSSEQLSELNILSQSCPMFYSRNMSLGVNAILSIIPALVRALDGYDIEIVEMHHRHKKDAPSGTALALAEAIVGALGVDLNNTATYGREGIAPRADGEIGIHALRGGGNSGEHTIILAHEGEEIRLTHRALSRSTFALGAIRAAQFVVNQQPRLYTMTDLINR